MHCKIMLPLTLFIIIMLAVRLISEEAEEFSLTAQGLKKVPQAELNYHLKQDTLVAKDSAESNSATSDSARAALNMRQQQS